MVENGTLTARHGAVGASLLTLGNYGLIGA